MSLWRRLRGSLPATAFEDSMEAELAHHLELETQALVARGMDPADARADARRRFGSVAQVKDACRDSWFPGCLRALDSIVQDTRYALRTLARHPGHACVVLLTLGLGIGANTAIFSVVHAVLLRSLPYANGDALVEIRQLAPGAGLGDVGLSALEVADYRRQAASFDAVVEYHQMGFNLLGSDGAKRVVTGVVSADFFDVIGVTPILGRTFRAEDDAKDAPPVLILGYSYWQHALGGDPRVIGRTFEMNDKVHTVVGVLPPVPQYPAENDVYMPLSACPFRSAPTMALDRTDRMLAAIGRLRPGMTIERARRDLALVAARMAAAHPDAYEAGAGFQATALSVRDELTRRARPTLLALLATTGFVLLLVCANVANLTLARLVGRERELRLRVALGAGRGRITRQLLTESAVLAVGGGALGLLVAAVTRSLLVAFTARFTPRAAEIGIDGSVLVFALGVSVATGLLFGLVPSLPHRGAVSRSLTEGARGESRRRMSARQALIGAQVAISFVLLIGAGLMVRSFIKLQHVDAGFNADHVLTVRVALDWVKYDTPEARRAYFRTLVDKLGTEPGVTSAALSLGFPLNESQPLTASFVVEGRAPVRGQPRPQADVRLASPAYFQTIGMTLLRGRVFERGDAAGAPAVAIVNLAMARHRFGGLDPVGRRISVDDRTRWVTVVGLVNDVKQYGLETSPADEIYVPFDQLAPLGATILVRTAGDPRASLAAVERVSRNIDPRQPLSHAETLEEARTGSLASARLTMLLVSLFAVVALIITAAGIAGVVSFSVNQRTTEIGVRMALGAPHARVVGMIVRQGLAPITIGLGCGLAGALLVTPFIERLLFAVDPTDPPTYAAVLATLTAVGALACVGPARRAAAIDPMRALRAD
jgi:putative ABC transport system permease protein